MHRENLIELENNAVIAFEEYGDANGVPVIFCHGWPSSRTMARLTDEPARDLGIRIVSPDRPGISASSLQPDRKLTDWPRLVERMADHLGIRDFRMLGISGGAPYAMRLPWHCRSACGRSQSSVALLPSRNLGTPADCSRFTAGCWHSTEPDRGYCERYFIWRGRFSRYGLPFVFVLCF